ncbi:hypothetical protein D049_1467A, partial [Vibrio parahaemolyticus VPTS-2010]|jgi:hypothetical protein
MYLL